MNDWLDSDEFWWLVVNAAKGERGGLACANIKAAIRQHFIEKGPGLFDAIISDCTDHIAAKTYEIDIEKLEKLCGIENERLALVEKT